MGAALNAAVDGDTILIAPGVHDGGVLVDKPITLASWFLASGDTAHIPQTVIRGTLGVPCEGDTICPGGAVLDFAPGSGGSAVTGLTITNGVDGINSRVILDISYCRIIGNGDGVDFQAGSGGTLRNSLFANNTDDGIDLNGRINASILDNIIRDNNEDGVEFRLYPYSGSRTNIDFIGNRITGNGSDGIQLIDYPGETDRVIRIERNVFSGNEDAAVGCLPDGRTIEDFSGAPMAERVFLIHNTFVGERYGFVGGANVVALNNIFMGTQASALRRVGGSSIVSYCLFWNNGINYEGSDEASHFDLPHLLFADPLLDAGYALTAGSPAMDAGTAFYEWQGETVLDLSPSSYLGSAPDMGTVEFDDGQANAAPGVNAGSDQSITLPADALLDGTVSDDGLPAPPSLLTTTWSLASGPGAVTFQDRNEIDTRATFTAAGTYVLSLTATDGALSATDQVTIAVLQHPDSNLVGNPSFEANANGWIGLSGTTLTRVAGGLDGGYAAQLTGTSATTSSFGLNDSPNWIRNTTAAGIRLRFTAWVRSMNSTGTARIHIREYLMSNGALQGEIMSAGVQLSPQWQMLAVEYVTRSAGTTLDANVKDFPLVTGETFLVDNVSVHRVGTVTAVEVQDPPPGRSSVRRVYPTPTRGLIHVEARGSVDGTASIRIVQPNGRIVRERRYSGLAPGQYRTFTIDTSGLPSGVYFLWYQGTNERKAGRKIILLK